LLYGYCTEDIVFLAAALLARVMYTREESDLMSCTREVSQRSQECLMRPVR